MSIARIVTANDLNALKASSGLRPRLNMHETFQDPVQQMLVVMRQGEERLPHANGRELTQIIKEGHGEMLIYNDAGEIIERFKINPDENFCYTLPAGVFHTRKIFSDVMVFFEILAGPYACGMKDVTELRAGAAPA